MAGFVKVAVRLLAEIDTARRATRTVTNTALHRPAISVPRLITYSGTVLLDRRSVIGKERVPEQYDPVHVGVVKRSTMPAGVRKALCIVVDEGAAVTREVPAFNRDPSTHLCLASLERDVNTCKVSAVLDCKQAAPRFPGARSPHPRGLCVRTDDDIDHEHRHLPQHRDGTPEPRSAERVARLAIGIGVRKHAVLAGDMTRLVGATQQGELAAAQVCRIGAKRSVLVAAQRAVRGRGVHRLDEGPYLCEAGVFEAT